MQHFTVHSSESAINYHLPLIEQRKLNQVDHRKKYDDLCGCHNFFAVMLLFSYNLCTRQVIKLKNAQKIIYEAHLKEHEVNEQLAETNLQSYRNCT